MPFTFQTVFSSNLFFYKHILHPACGDRKSWQVLSPRTPPAHGLQHTGLPATKRWQPPPAWEGFCQGLLRASRCDAVPQRGALMQLTL